MTQDRNWEPPGVGKRGGQLKYSDVAIETALTLRLIFNLPLRQTEGFLSSLFGMMGIDLSVPDHTTLSRRGQHLDVRLRRVPRGKATQLIVDSTGLSIVGEGEWAAVKHGGKGKRGWKKLHVGVDRSGVIVAQVLTDGNTDDAVTGLSLIEEVGGDIASFTADAACDTIKKLKKIGRRRWKKESGYHCQARVENTFFRSKSIIGDRLHARHAKAQEAEAVMACNILNRMTELGRPTSFAIGA